MKKNIAIVVLAIVAALGLTTTGAVAGIGIGKGNIGSWHIKDGTIKGKDLKPGIRQKAKNGNKALRKIHRNQAAWSRDSQIGNVLHNSKTEQVPPKSNGHVINVTCAEGDFGDAANGDAKGYVATGGGFNTRDRSGDVVVNQSRFLINLPGENYENNGKGWMVQVNNTTDQPQEVQAWVVCVYAPDDDNTD